MYIYIYYNTIYMYNNTIYIYIYIYNEAMFFKENVLGKNTRLYKYSLFHIQTCVTFSCFLNWKFISRVIFENIQNIKRNILAWLYTRSLDQIPHKWSLSTPYPILISVDITCRMITFCLNATCIVIILCYGGQERQCTQKYQQ